MHGTATYGVGQDGSPCQASNTVVAYISQPSPGAILTLACMSNLCLGTLRVHVQAFVASRFNILYCKACRDANLDP